MQTKIENSPLEVSLRKGHVGVRGVGTLSRWILVMGCLVIALSSRAAETNAAPAQVPLVNAQFADGLKGWTMDGIPGSKAEEGAACLQLSDKVEAGRLFQDVHVQPGQIYRLSYSAKFVAPGHGGICITPCASNFKKTGQVKWMTELQKWGPVKRNISWEEGAVVFETSEDTDLVRVGLHVAGAGGQAAYKDITLQLANKENP